MPRRNQHNKSIVLIYNYNISKYKYYNCTVVLPELGFPWEYKIISKKWSFL